MTEERWKNKSPCHHVLEKGSLDEITWHRRHSMGRSVMRFYDSGLDCVCFWNLCPSASGRSRGAAAQCGVVQRSQRPSFEPYNIILSTHSLLMHTDVIVMPVREALHESCRSNFDV